MFDILYVYFYMLIITLVITLVARGYNEQEYNKKDITDSVLWPLTYLVILGTLIKVIVNKLNRKKKEIDERY